MKLWKMVAIVVCLSSSLVMAGDKSSGCGLGWQVLKKNSLVSSSLRFTTNTSLLNTIAMTFGTSGCAKHSIVKNKVKGIHYAEANFRPLMIEMAQGKGEYLSGFAAVMGCDAENFAPLVQTHYTDIFQQDTDTPLQMYQNLKEEMGKDHNFNCAVI